MFMNNDFSEQPKIQTVGVLPMRRPAEYQELRSNDPALRAMTDFTSKIAITVAPDRQIDAALTDMMRLSVRAMLVLRGDSVIGLITSYDIEGPRPLRLAERPDVSREDIKVGDIMTEWDDLPTLDWHTVQTARISDILEIFDGVGVMHLLVVESDERGAEVVRGLISRSRIERHLHGEQFPPPIAGDGSSNKPQWKVIVEKIAASPTSAAPAASVNPPQ
jgi:DeoR family transcriptional regulator, catabolite repression regulator